MMPLSRPARVLVSIAVVSLVAMGLFYAFRAAVDWRTRLVAAVAAAIVAGWVLYSRRADRRYAQVLEDEVAKQTRSLMSSLGATASAERNLRLLMEAVPDAITVVDRDGCVLDENTSGRVLVNAFPGDTRESSGKRSACGSLEGTAAGIGRGNLTAAYGGELCSYEVPLQRPEASDWSDYFRLGPLRDVGLVH